MMAEGLEWWAILTMHIHLILATTATKRRPINGLSSVRLWVHNMKSPNVDGVQDFSSPLRTAYYPNIVPPHLCNLRLDIPSVLPQDERSPLIRCSDLPRHCAYIPPPLPNPRFDNSSFCCLTPGT